MFVIWPFVDEETNGSYPFAKWTKWTCPSMAGGCT
jgi:hypothetical protein